MYNKEEAKKIRTEFWTGFGQYMNIHISARGPKQKWLNYRTGIRHLFFRWEATNKIARVSIDIQHRDPGIRELFFEQFEELKLLLESTTGTNWSWLPKYQNEVGLEIARIEVTQTGWNMFNQADWPAIWNWMEPIVIGLDEVWADALEIFKDLAE